MTVTDFEALPGAGVTASVDGRAVIVGSARLLTERGVEMPDNLRENADTLAEQGKTLMFVAVDGECHRRVGHPGPGEAVGGARR